MVKHIHIILDDGEYKELVEYKEDKSWKDLLLSNLPIRIQRGKER